MSLVNTPTSFGSLSRSLHWLTALLILTAIPLGLIANSLPADASTIASKTLLFSLHKTLGVVAFFLGLARILAALLQPHPLPLHPKAKIANALAALVHWMLYISLVAVPLTGWIHHAALSGFAPILWPFGQDLPFVEKSQITADLFAAAHWLFTKLLVASVLLHIAGALKHHLIDRDDTLRRMTRGLKAPLQASAKAANLVPMLCALAIYAAAAALVFQMQDKAPPAATAAPPQTASQALGGNWQVSQGSLGFDVKQMGAEIAGSFASWSAEISFDETTTSGPAGEVLVMIDIGSLTLGAVTDQAKSADFFDVASYKTAQFKAQILAEAGSYQAVGILTIRGIARPLTLPFSLSLTGDTAQMQAAVSLDRRDFGIGAGFADESTVGFPVAVKIALTAERS